MADEKKRDETKGVVRCKNADCRAVLTEARVIEPGPVVMVSKDFELKSDSESEDQYAVCEQCGWRTYFRPVVYDEGRLTGMEAYRAQPPEKTDS